MMHTIKRHNRIVKLVINKNSSTLKFNDKFSLIELVISVCVCERCVYTENRHIRCFRSAVCFLV